MPLVTQLPSSYTEHSDAHHSQDQFPESYRYSLHNSNLWTQPEVVYGRAQLQVKISYELKSLWYVKRWKMTDNNFYSLPVVVFFLAFINLLKPSGFCTYHQVKHSKILHGARFALSVLHGYQNRQRLLLYTALTGWFL